MSGVNVAVVGAGIIGLQTALELQKELRGSQITLYSDKFNEDTTSAVAAGIFRPGTNFIGPDIDTTKRWIKDSYQYYNEFLSKPEASNAGITQLSGYLFSSTHESLVRNEFLENVVPVYRKATREELKLCPGNWKFGSFFTTILTETQKYLPWAMAKLRENNAVFINKQINNFGELSSHDIILNCTGLYSKYLCKDSAVVPMRGQVLKVDAPWLKTFFYGDYDTYVIPGFDSVTLGGCRQYDSYDMNVNKYDTMAIQERCYSLVPGLKNAPVKRTCVGLRPYRSSVRVEKEITFTANDHKLKIVHNYGHGGYGVTSAPGTAMYAVKLAKELLAGNSKL